MERSSCREIFILQENLALIAQKVQEFLGDGSKYGVRLTYIVQGEPKGIAHAVNCAKDFMGDDQFIVYLGDNLLKNGIKAIPKKMQAEKADCVISLCPVPEPQRYGIAELSPDGKDVLSTVENPKEPKSNLTVIGVYAFNTSFFAVYPKLKLSWGNEMEITDAISLLISEGFKVSLDAMESVKARSEGRQDHRCGCLGRTFAWECIDGLRTLLSLYCQTSRVSSQPLA